MYPFYTAITGRKVPHNRSSVHVILEYFDKKPDLGVKEVVMLYITSR